MFSDELSDLMNDSEKVIAEEVTNLFSELIKASPVDTGSFRSAWELNETKNFTWTISNNMEYASILFDGRRKVGNRYYGSEQWSEGGEPMLQRFNNRIQKRLNSL